MSTFQSLMQKGEIASELLRYFWRRKLWWLIPMVTVLVMFGIFMVFVEGTGLAPFIYTLF